MNKSVLDYREYADDIGLFDTYVPEEPVRSSKEKEELVDSLLGEMDLKRFNISSLDSLDYKSKRQALLGVLNTLNPQTLSAEGVLNLNHLLQSELREKTVYSQEDLIKEATLDIHGTKIGIFQGDISTLQVDAIVNAANSQMLGCFQPLHRCIDNVIHSAAGVQLRDDCNRIMIKQGNPEPTGKVKITRAYNLPSRFVLHTVGPIIRDNPGSREEQLLKNCYTECLDVCASIPEIRSIAFCCISTGVFGYPQDLAASVAFRSVTEWVEEHPDKIDFVLFNVFTDKDRELYSSLLGK